MRTTKIISLLVILLLWSSVFALAAETFEVPEDVVEEQACGLGCKIWEFLFGNPEARAGGAWFDRSGALVGEAEGQFITQLDAQADENKEKALQLYNAGLENYNNKKYEGALINFREADRIVPSSGVKYKIADTLQQLGKKEESLIAWQEFLKSNPSSDKYSTEIKYAQGRINEIPTWTKETDSQFHESGTVYKNAKGDLFIVPEKEKDGVLLSEYLQKNSASSDSNLGQTIADLKLILGDVNYAQYLKQLKVEKTGVFTRSLGTDDTSDDLLVMTGKRGEIIIEKEARDDRVYVAKRLDKNSNIVERYLLRDGELLVSQKSDGTVIVGETTYNFPKGQLDQHIDDLAEGIQLPGEDGPSGFMQLKDNAFFAIDYEEETMQRVKKGESEDLKGDYYKKGSSECKTDGGCFVPTGGTAVIDGKEYLVDYDYEEQFGAERELEDKEYFDRVTGRQEGTELADGAKVFALKDENGYTGKFKVTDIDGSEGTITIIEDENGNLVPVGDNEVANAFLADPELKQLVEDRYSSTQGALAGAQDALQSIYAVNNQLKSYPAISNLLFGEEQFYRDWLAFSDQVFAPLLSETWFTSAICEAAHWNDIEPEGKAVIKTDSGTYQAVASIQMERSPETFPILCHKNPDAESEELFVCQLRQVCVDDHFCHADVDRDNEADSDEPLKGYFYKITWAVSSPQDEAFTAYKDENGVAVSFNIFLYPGAVPMYNMGGNIVSPIQLQNGARDKDAIIKYSTNVYDKACIQWHQAPKTTRSFSDEGTYGGGDIGEVCYGIEDEGFISSVGQVNWERAGLDAGSVTVSHGQLSRNTDW